MKSEMVPVCSFPTTVMLVDDSQHFLNGINTDLLNSRNILPLPFNNARKALKYLNEDYQPQRFTGRCLKNEVDTKLEQRIIDINLKAIRQEIYNNSRFKEIAVVLVDYDMPDLEGLEFCKKISDPWIKKVLLTGAADEKLAMEAFNQGLIDKFIRKDIPDFYRTVSAVIQELQHQYFCDLSRIIVENLARKSISELCCLEDPAFIEFFTKICKKNEIVEYYLADECGSILLLDFAGQPKWLGIKNQTDMQVALEIADCSDDVFPSSLLQTMKGREKMLYIYGETYSDDLAKCEKYMFPAKKLMGQQTYYYTFIENPSTFDISLDKVLSYKTWLAKVKQ